MKKKDDSYLEKFCDIWCAMYGKEIFPDKDKRFQHIGVADIPLLGTPFLLNHILQNFPKPSESTFSNSGSYRTGGELLDGLGNEFSNFLLFGARTMFILLVLVVGAVKGILATVAASIAMPFVIGNDMLFPQGSLGKNTSKQQSEELYHNEQDYIDDTVNVASYATVPGWD